MRLGGIALLTFTATVIGGSFLVGYGLAPLRRLTEAVSRVTSRDFSLPLDDKKLPRELDPIATRLQVTLDELKRASSARSRPWPTCRTSCAHLWPRCWRRSR